MHVVCREIYRAGSVPHVTIIPEVPELSNLHLSVARDLGSLDHTALFNSDCIG